LKKSSHAILLRIAAWSQLLYEKSNLQNQCSAVAFNLSEIGLPRIYRLDFGALIRVELSFSHITETNICQKT
jgi:hypothetical protein